jgi:DNA-binding response OmpR family regulator
VAAGGVDLVLLDLGLPDVDGLEVCRRLRADGFEGGIIILTARGGELDRVVGLDVGADDYLGKPFSLAELLARARALLRRSAPRPVAAAPGASASASGLRVDPHARRVWVGDGEVVLTVKEFDVLALLDVDRGAVVTRERIMDEVWDENWFGSTKTLDTTLGRLRQKLEEHAAPARIVTVRGVGFRLEDDAADA